MIDLRTIALEYELDLKGVVVPTPYWINWAEAPYFLDAPFRGKGTPAQIKAAVRKRLGRLKHPPTTPEAIRSLMRSAGLGIDCSGLAFYILNKFWQKKRQLGLADILIVHAEEIEEAISRHPERAVKVTADLRGQDLSLAQVCDMFNKHAAEITNVQRLTDPATATIVTQAQLVQPGDMIRMHGQSTGFDHVAVVTEVVMGVITYVSSEDLPGEPGGLRFRQIFIQDPAAGLEFQRWEQSGLYRPDSGNGDGVWRLTGWRVPWV